MNSPNELSFLPDDYMERKAQRRTNAICAILFLVVAGAIGSAFWVTERTVHNVEYRLTSLESECAEAAKPIQQFQMVQEKERTLTRQAEIASSLLEKVPRYFLLAELTNRLPVDTALTDFTLDAKRRVARSPAAQASTAFEAKKAELLAKPAGPPAPEPQVYDVTLRLTGLCGTDVQVAQYMSKLAQCPLLSEVNLVQTELYQPPQTEQKLRRFQIEAILDPKAAVQATTPTPSLPGATAAVELNR